MKQLLRGSSNHPVLSRIQSCGLCSRDVPPSAVSDPQEAHLGSKIGSVPDVGEEGVRVTGGAGRHAGPLRHCVVMDVFWQDAALLQENSGTGSDLVSRYHSV